MTTRFGVIGYGAWGSHHAAAIAGLGETTLIAVAANTDDSQAKARSDHPNAAVVGDYRDLLARDDVDAVSIVLPTPCTKRQPSPPWRPASTSCWKSRWRPASPPETASWPPRLRRAPP